MASPKPQLPLKDWLTKYAKDRLVMSKRGEDARTMTTVALQRRFRGASLSDQIGCFIPGGTGMWRGDNPEDLEGLELKTVNITKPTIKMGMAALASARVAINNESSNKSEESKGAANVADGISQWLDNDDNHWTGGLEQRIMQMCQTGYGYFVQAKFNPNKQADFETSTQEWSDEETSMPGEYSCRSCGGGGSFDDQLEEGAEQVNCPECGEMAEVMKAPEMANIPRPGEKQRVTMGDSETCVSSCLEHRVDERKSQGGNLLMAQWFEHHYLVTLEELAVDFPEEDFGDAGEWCYALKWKWSLESGDDVFASNYMSEDYRKRYERRDLYLLPAEYAHRIEPDDCEIKSADGEVVFSIKKGERLADKMPRGFCFTMIGEHLAPYWRECDFRDEWSYGGYLSDAHSFWYQPLVEILQLQDDWNTLYTIDMQHRERNSISQIAYVNDMFDADAWEQDLVPSAEGRSLEGQPIGHYFQQVSPAPMTEAIAGLEFLFKIGPYVGLAPPESIGVDPPGTDNYHAQLLRKQSTLGQLQPPGESKASCKVHHYRNIYKIAQETWPVERFQYIRTRFGEEWKDDDIEAFIQCDVDRDIVSNYVEGTEVPTTYIERRMDLEQVIQKYIDAQQMPPQELIRQYMDLLGVDYDMGGIEADERLADARYETIKEGLKTLTGTLSDQPTVQMDPMSGQPVEGPSPLIQAVMSHPQLRVLPKENHQVAIDFYVAHEKAAMAQQMPEINLVDCLEEMIKRHEMGGVEQGQTENAAEVAKQAPVLAAQQAMQPPPEQQPDPQAEAQAQAGLQAQQQQADAAQQGEDRDMQAANDHAQRQHDMAKQDKDHAHQMQMKQLELVSRERSEIARAKEQAKRPAAA
jgi:hypothetical protein